MVNIKTGVDNLVELISTKKKISVDDAAKILGVGSDVVEEWAEFLEEEGLVALDYSLSKVYILEKKISKDQILNSAKSIISEKDAFTRKIDVAIEALTTETIGFEELKKQFQNIESHVKSEVDAVRTQLNELEKFETLKDTLSKDMDEQKKAYDSLIKESETIVKTQEEEFSDLKNAISNEKRNLEQYSHKVLELKQLRIDYERTVENLKNSLGSIDKVLIDYKKKIDESSKNITQLDSQLNQITKNVDSYHKDTLSKKLEVLTNDHLRLLKNQDNLENDLHEKTLMMRKYGESNSKIRSSFDGFFSKTIATEKLINEIEKDKLDLHSELELLKKKVLSFTLAISSEDLKKQLKEIESQMKKYDSKRGFIREKVEKLLLLIKGPGEDSKSENVVFKT